MKEQTRDLLIATLWSMIILGLLFGFGLLAIFSP